MSGPQPVPGRSTSKDVEAMLGAPSERLSLRDGASAWYYTRAGGGRETMAVRFSAGGVVQSIEQVLTVQSIAKLAPGVTTAREVREILGPPLRVTRQDRQARNIWEYQMYNEAQFDFDLFVQFSEDGVVREVHFMKDYHKEPDG